MSDNALHYGSATEFLAHAYALEEEFIERYQELADCMEVHHHADIAELFTRLSRLSRSHMEKLMDNVHPEELPKIAPWEFHWLDMKGPHNCMEDAHYQMHHQQALELALTIENGGLSFYEQVASSANDDATVKIAQLMIAEKEEHIHLLSRWHKEAEDQEEEKPHDLDPPHIPE